MSAFLSKYDVVNRIKNKNKTLTFYFLMAAINAAGSTSSNIQGPRPQSPTTRTSPKVSRGNKTNNPTSTETNTTQHVTNVQDIKKNTAPTVNNHIAAQRI